VEREQETNNSNSNLDPKRGEVYLVPLIPSNSIFHMIPLVFHTHTSTTPITCPPYVQWQGTTSSRTSQSPRPSSSVSPAPTSVQHLLS
jgi:hypothetical protein